MPPPIEAPTTTRTHVYQSSLHASPQANGRRSFDALFKKTQPQPTPTTKDQALADQRLTALLRQKGSQILRQRLLYLLRKQFHAEFERNDTCGLLQSVEDLIISTDNTDAAMIGYLKQFSSKVNVAEQPCLSTERMASMPSFILTGPSQLDSAALSGGAAGAASNKFGGGIANSNEADSTTGDEADVDAIEKDTNNFYTMFVKRVPGTGTVYCPYCSKSLDEVPVVTPDVVTEDVGTNTVERQESEKDSLLAILTKTKNECEKKVEDLRKELAAFKKAKYASQNLQIAAPATQQQQQPATGYGGTGSQSGLLSPLMPVGPLVGSFANDDIPLSAYLPPNRASSITNGNDELPARANSVTAGMASSPNSKNSNGGGAGTTSTARDAVPGKLKRASSGVLTRPTAGSISASAASSPTGVNPSGLPLSSGGGSGGVSSSSIAGDLIQVKVGQLSRFLILVKELRAKMNAIRSGVRAFQHKDVLQQVGHHVLPQIHALQTTNKRLLERDYLLEKLILDALCKVGTMPDVGSPEGYLPEGGPLHVGTYSLLDDRRFFEWTRRISDALTAKVNAVQSYISSLSNEAKSVTDATNLSKKEVGLLEDRCSALESSLVENECFNVSNILDHTFDSSTSVQASKKSEFVTLLKQAAETNEEIRLVYVLPNWAQKGQLRAKVNMWRQRRIETLQKIEQLLSQELQSSIGSGAQKIILKGKLMTLRELIQIASRLHLMPNLRPVALNKSPPPQSKENASGGSTRAAVTAGALLPEERSLTSPTSASLPVQTSGAEGTSPRTQSAGSDSSSRVAEDGGSSPVTESFTGATPSAISTAQASSGNGGATALASVRSPLVKRRQGQGGPSSPSGSTQKLPPMNATR